MIDINILLSLTLINSDKSLLYFVNILVYFTIIENAQQNMIGNEIIDNNKDRKMNMSLIKSFNHTNRNVYVTPQKFR